MTDRNRESWDYANTFFNAQKGDFATAIREGKKALPDEIMAVLGLPKNARVLHLMCNDGREAAYVTYVTGATVDGLDFSGPAVDFARRLDAVLGLGNRFILAEAMSWLETESARYDVVLTTLGTLRWIEDLPGALNLLAAHLVGGGRIVFWDFHPIAGCVGSSGEIERPYPIASGAYERPYGVIDYVSSEADYTLVSRSPRRATNVYSNPSNVRFAEHGLASIIGAILSCPVLLLSRFEEYDFVWEERTLPWLTETSEGRFEAPDDAPTLPLTFLVEARKSAST